MQVELILKGDTEHDTFDIKLQESKIMYNNDNNNNKDTINTININTISNTPGILLLPHLTKHIAIWNALVFCLGNVGYFFVVVVVVASSDVKWDAVITQYVDFDLKLEEWFDEEKDPKKEDKNFRTEIVLSDMINVNEMKHKSLSMPGI